MTQEVAPEENKSEEVAPEENITLAAIPKRDNPNNNSPASKQDIVCVTVTGPLAAVKRTIFTLYQLGFAEVDDWSPVQRGANPQQAISVLIRRQRAIEDKQQAKQPGAIE